jgi:gliding motility-associated-like protein
MRKVYLCPLFTAILLFLSGNILPAQPPQITGQNTTPSIAEDTFVDLDISHLDVTDEDPGFPAGFALRVEPGSNYTFDGTRVTPAPDFNGDLIVNVVVIDPEMEESDVFADFHVTVTPVNDAPFIAGQVNNNVHINEEGSLTLSVSDLTIDDPDVGDTYTLIIEDGDDYTHSGSGITPDADFAGLLKVKVHVNDGTDNSNTYEYEVTVDNVNDLPFIAGQVNNSVEIDEESNLALNVSDLIINDPDEGDTHTLVIEDGTDYTHSGSQITPVDNFTGPLKVKVHVNDGTDNSNTYEYELTVNNINDPPSIAGQANNSVEIDEETSLTLSLSDLIFDDPDAGDTHTLVIEDGTDYTHSGSEITPVTNFAGLLKVKVHVNDGTDDSNTYEYEITVNNVNDLPFISGQVNNSVEIDEGSTLTLSVSDLIIDDPDAGDTHTLVIEDGPNYTHSGSQVTPIATFSGPLAVRVHVNDGTGDSNTYDYALTVNSVNEPPVIAGQVHNNVEIDEESTLTLSVSDLIINDPDAGDTHTLIIEDGTNYTHSGSQVTPVVNFAGPLKVRVHVNDGTDDSNTYEFEVTVNNVNDLPFIAGQVNNAVEIDEEGTLTLSVTDLIIDDPDAGDTHTLVIENGTNYTHTSFQVTPVANYSGPLEVNVHVNDGVGNSNTYEYQLTVNEVNDLPTITGQNTVPETDEGTPLALNINHLDVTDADHTFPTGFVLNVNPGTDYSVSGTTITPNEGVESPIVVKVTVTDPSGGESNEFDFNVEVNAVNEAPLITGQQVVSVDEDNSFTIEVGHLTISDPDGDTNFSITINEDGPDYNFAGTTVTPIANYFGDLTIPITVSDGDLSSPLHSFLLTVNAVNDAPTISPIGDIEIDEDADQIGIPLTGITAGPLETQDITLFASTDNAALFEVLAVEYTSPSTTGTLNVKPAPNAFGTANARVTVRDNGPNTPPHENTFFTDFKINVHAAVDPPVIVDQNTIPTTQEETPIALDITHLDVTDTDNNNFPTGFVLNVKTGDDYSVGSGTTITPDTDVTGTINVRVTVSDPDGFESNEFFYQVNVDAVNDLPSITGQNTTPTTPEETPIALNINHLSVTDVDNSFPTGFTLNVKPGTGYSVGAGTTITPDVDVTGTIDVVVSVTDPAGGESPHFQTFKVNVTEVNDDPTLDPLSPLEIDEDAGLQTVNLAGISAGPNEGSQVLNITASSNNTTLIPNPTVSYTPGSATGSISFTPAADRSGTADITVTVTDNGSPAKQVSRTFTVTINEVNDLPTIDDITDRSAPEVSLLPAIHVVNFQGVTDGSANELQELALTVTVTSDNTTLFPTAVPLLVPLVGTGTITITQAPNVSGSATFTVTVSDGVDEITEQFVFTITSVNDPPSFEPIDEDVVVNEDAGPQDVAINNVSPGPGETQNITFTAVSSNPTLIPNPTIAYTQGQSTATLTFESAANQSGTAVITVTAEDAEGAQFTDDFNIVVQPINDAPTITSPGTINIDEDAAQQGIALSGISAGPLENQTISVGVSAANPGLFQVLDVAYTSPNATGTLNIQPAPNQAGSTQVTITVTDDGPGTAPNVNTTQVNFTVNVNAVNDPPVITGQDVVSVDEDNNFTILVSHLNITDPDNPSGPFTISVQDGTNYTHSGAVITPTQNYYGDLTIPLTVSDGTNSSAVFNFLLTVNPVNDTPTITGQDPISIDEEESIELTVDLLQISDPDPEDVFPDDFTLTVVAGANYSVTGTTITPAPNFTGDLDVPVFVRDPAGATSNMFTLTISVGSVNDPPVITGQAVALNINEDQSVVLALNQLNVTDPDNPPGDLSLIVQSGPNYTFSGLTVTPSQDFNGPLQVRVVVSDGDLNSAQFNMLVTVNPVNDAPQIVDQNPVTTTEDVPVTLSLADLVVDDPDSDDPYPEAFTMQAFLGSNYTLNGLTVTPALDFTGTLSVPVEVHDGTINSNRFNLQIQVTDENDVPVINGQDPLPLVTAEDTPVTIQLSHLQVSDTDNTYPDDFSIVIQSGANYTYSGSTVTPVPDFTGTLMVTLRVNDGQNNSPAFAFEILVVGDNDPPVITAQKQLSVPEDQTLEIKLTDLTVTDPDPEDVYPDDFTLTVLAGTNYTVEGTTIRPAANYFGTLTVPVRVSDGVNNSAPFNLVVQVTAVNDPPSIGPIDDVIIAENTEDYVIQVTGISPGPLETQNLNFSVTSSNSNLLNPTFSYNGTGSTATITLNPAPNQTGTVTITVKVIDPGLLEGSQVFTVRIEDINAAPTLDPIAFGPIPEDSPVQTIPLTGISAGPGENQTLTLSAVADKPELFETFTWTYTSPQPTGSLTVLPKPDVYGDVVITVTVTDNGSNEGPHVNFITRQFTLEITPVADPPVFISEPIELALIGEPYEYAIDVADTDPGAVITLEAAQAPAWLTLTQVSNGKATLSGTPPPGSAGSVLVSLKATDDTDEEVFQNFTLIVDTRPVLSDFTITAEEDVARNIEKIRFDAAFEDADEDFIQTIKIVKLPENGQLFVGTVAINEGQEISVTDLANFTYKGLPDYTGRDTIVWNAFDGSAYAAAPARIFVTVTPVNDPPVIVNLETVTLTVNAGEGPVQISTEFEVEDVDNELLTGAEIRFRGQNFVAEDDQLIFEPTSKISGTYEEETGILNLTGIATVAEYNAAIRSIRYDNVSSVFSTEEVIKTISYTVSDGTALSVPRDREIRLIDTFEELVIPNGFTPNSDGDNDRWLITNLERHVDASVRVYTIMGQVVYESDGVYEGWDGTYNGQLLPSDTYYYTIDLNLPFRKKVYKGAVTLLR